MSSSVNPHWSNRSAAITARQKDGTLAHYAQLLYDRECSRCLASPASGEVPDADDWKFRPVGRCVSVARCGDGTIYFSNWIEGAGEPLMPCTIPPCRLITRHAAPTEGWRGTALKPQRYVRAHHPVSASRWPHLPSCPARRRCRDRALRPQQRHPRVGD